MGGGGSAGGGEHFSKIESRRGRGEGGGRALDKKDATSAKHTATLTEFAMTPNRQTSQGTLSFFAFNTIARLLMSARQTDTPKAGACGRCRRVGKKWSAEEAKDEEEETGEEEEEEKKKSKARDQ